MCVCAQLCLTLCNPWTVARQVSLYMGFSRQEYWSGMPLPPPGDFPDLGMELMSLASPSLAGSFLSCFVFPLAPPGKPRINKWVE